MSSFQCLLAKYDQVDSPPSGILDEYTDDDYYLSNKKSKKKSNKGGKTTPPSSGRRNAKTFSMSSVIDTKSSDEGNFSNIYTYDFLMVN